MNGSRIGKLKGTGLIIGGGNGSARGGEGCKYHVCIVFVARLETLVNHQLKGYLTGAVVYATNRPISLGN